MDIINEVSKLLNSVPPSALTPPPDPPDPSFIQLGPRRVYVIADPYSFDGGYIETRDRDRADLVGSKDIQSTDIHWPAIDIDHGIRVIPSATPGHNHLYIEVAMSWKKYKKLLKAMVKAGLVEKGYYIMAKKNKETHLRVPEKPKGAPTAKKLISRVSLGYY